MRIPDNHHDETRPSQGYIGSLGAADKAQDILHDRLLVDRATRTDRAENDGVLLLALKLLDGPDFRNRQPVGDEAFPDELRLQSVGRDDADIIGLDADGEEVEH